MQKIVTRRATKSYCLTTPLKSMGFSQKASCKSQGFIKRTSRKNNGKYVVSRKYKSKNKSLYSDGTKKPRIKSGYGTEQKAKDTLKRIKNYNSQYQYQVVNTLYNRAKYHANQTSDMRKAMKVFKEWIKKKKKEE